MRAMIYVLAIVLAMAPFASAGAQNTGNPSTTPGTRTPVRQPTTSPPAAAPMPSPQTSPTPARPNAANPANTQQRVPPASRGVGTTGKPDCSKLRGLEKSECERRDTTRDDLPAGVTPKQPPK